MIISINGNIGSGKSTLLDMIKDVTEMEIIQEPINEWNILLQQFYNDPSRWALAFQIKVLTSQMGQLLDKKDIIIERDPITAREIFWNMLYHDNIITEEEYTIYNELYRLKFYKVPDVVFYIDTKPEICWERIQKRLRYSESDITFDYIKKLDAYHRELYFTNFEKKYPNAKLYIINGNGTESETYRQLIDCISF